MTTLATLDPTKEELLQQVERESGAWLLAYDPSAAQAGAPPSYAEGLTPARLDAQQVERLRTLEQQTGTVIVAYQPEP